VDREFPEGDLRRTKPLFTRENRVKAVAMLEQVKPIAEAHHATLGQVFLAWIVAQPGMTTALAGARNEAQVRENAGAGDLQLADDEIAQIRDWVEQGWPV
jgi:methylglyoxal reductase